MGKRKQNIAMYSPYVPEHEGGGERHFFSVAEVLSQSNNVTVLIGSHKDNELQKKYGNKFNLDLKKVKFKKSSIGTASSIATKLLETSKYDIFYYLTDGSLFFSLAKKNILHIQFPFTFKKDSLVERLKLANWRSRNTNSEFTKKIVEKSWSTRIQHVHYPYVDTRIFQPLEKEKIILSVGRFFSGEMSGMHCKRQDVMVDMFRSMVDQGLAEGWKLVLLGSVDPGKDNQDYAEQIHAKAKGYPIKILHNASFDVLKQYYAHASIYWHAAGYGIDEQVQPTKVEHFGIAPLEAMASGAVPVMINKGGLKETVEHGVNGFLWDTMEQGISYTRKLMMNKDLCQELQKNVIERAKHFNKKRFEKTLQEMVQ